MQFALLMDGICGKRFVFQSEFIRHFIEVFTEKKISSALIRMQKQTPKDGQRVNGPPWSEA
jgi:hypothetical protein